MDYYTLIDLWCNHCDIDTLVILQRVCKIFYIRLNSNTNTKMIATTLQLQFNSTLTLNDYCHMHNIRYIYTLFINDSNKRLGKEYIRLCLLYDKYYLMDESVTYIKSENIKLLDLVFDSMCKSIKPTKSPNVLDFIVKKGYIWYDKASDAIYFDKIINNYVKKDNIELTKHFLIGCSKFSSLNVKNKLLNGIYTKCRTKGMFLLLKQFRIDCVHKVFNIIHKDNDVVIDCIIKYGNEEEKQLLAYTSLRFRDINKKILNWIDKDGFNKYIDDDMFERILSEKNETVLTNLCKYGNKDDKLIILGICRDMNGTGAYSSLKCILDIMLKHGDVKKYLGDDYFNVKKGKSKSEIIYDLIISMDK